MTSTGRHCCLMAVRAGASVPLVPALPMAASIFVTSTGRFRGKAVASASLAVTTMPMTAVEMILRALMPSLTSFTRMPWW